MTYPYARQNDGLSSLCTPKQRFIIPVHIKTSGYHPYAQKKTAYHPRAHQKKRRFIIIEYIKTMAYHPCAYQTTSYHPFAHQNVGVPFLCT